jgi:phage/plasmid-associated DNA primase
VDYDPEDDDTPALDSILRAQNLHGNAYWATLAFMGRLLFPPDHDCWQRALVLAGLGGTGKSLLANACARMVGSSVDVPSSAQARWIGGTLEGKDLMVCTDMGRDCSWPKTLFLTLVGDQRMSIERKYAHPKEMAVSIQLLLLTNTGLPWGDEKGELRRRAVVVPFSAPVATPRPSLDVELEAEHPAIFCKALYSYHMLRGDVGDGDVGEALAAIPEFAAAVDAYL